jgi:hypothetical protein
VGLFCIDTEPTDNEIEVCRVSRTVHSGGRPTLPAEKQQEILSHATRLRDEAARKKPFKSVKGLWADLGISLSADDIEENQREMWKDFPREDI